MSSNNRATQINKVLKITKKHFQPYEIAAERTLLEHLIYACCAENSLYDAADQVFASLATDYYDWNEVRVTSIRELTDLMKPLNDASDAATRLKRVLQSVFETHYSFDLEHMKKQNIGQTVKQLEKYNGTTNYTVAFVTQNALGGHAIPINRGLLEAMRVVGVVSDNEAKKGTVPGLERAVPKSKGIEVGSILHQLGVELGRSPYGPTIRKLLLEIEPTCKDNLPKRPSKKVEKPVAAGPPETKPAAKEKGKKTPAKADAKSTKQAAAQASSAQKPTKKKVVKKAASKKPTKKSKAKQSTPTKKKKSPVKKKKVKKKKAGKSTSPDKKKKQTTKKVKKRKPK